MKLYYLYRFFGNRDVSTVGNDLVDVDLLAPRKSFLNLKHFHGFQHPLVVNLFRKQKPSDHMHSCHQHIDVRAIEASLMRGERKISKLECQINRLDSDKHKLITKVSDQTKVISELKKTVLDQTKEISKLNKIILSQKDEIEEIQTNGEINQTLLQWYRQNNDDLCKRLVVTKNELDTLQKSVDKNIV